MVAKYLETLMNELKKTKTMPKDVRGWASNLIKNFLDKNGENEIDVAELDSIFKKNNEIVSKNGHLAIYSQLLQQVKDWSVFENWKGVKDFYEKAQELHSRGSVSEHPSPLLVYQLDCKSVDNGLDAYRRIEKNMNMDFSWSLENLPKDKEKRAEIFAALANDITKQTYISSERVPVNIICPAKYQSELIKTFNSEQLAELKDCGISLNINGVSIEQTTHHVKNPLYSSERGSHVPLSPNPLYESGDAAGGGGKIKQSSPSKGCRFPTSI